MLQVFSFTDEKLRTFQWGLDEDRGETQIICAVTQDFSIPVWVKDGDATIEKIRAMQVPGFGKGTTAQIAYDAALADLVVNLRDADAKLRAMADPTLVDVTLDEGPHRLFGPPDEEKKA